MAMLSLWPFLQSSDCDGTGASEVFCEDLDLYCLKAADHTLASLYFLTAVFTDVPKSSEGKTGTSRRKAFSFSLLSARFNYRRLSVATIAAIE